MSGSAPDPRNDLERSLAESLHGHLDSMTASSDLTAPAIKRSHRLRRNRALATGAGVVLAAVAIATPFALSGLRDDGRLIDPGPVRSTITDSTPPATGSPVLTETGTAPPTSSAGRPTAGQAPTGQTGGASGTRSGDGTPPATAAPTHDADGAPLATVRPSFALSGGSADVSYVHGTTVHDLVRDREVTLEVATDSQLGAVNGLFADGSVLGTVLSGREWDVVVWDGATGAERARLPSGSVLALDSGRTLAAYSDAAERLHVIDSSGEVVATAPRAGLLATGIIGDTVFVNDIRSAPPRGYTWNLRSGALKGFAGLFGAAHEGAGLVIYRPATGTGGRSCFRLLDATADLSVRWTACGDYDPVEFSPSGDFLVGGLGVDGGSPYDVWVMRTSDARRILRVDGNANGLMLGMGGIDNRDRALTLMAQNGDLDQALLRCPLDGSRCTVVGAPERLDTSTPSGVSPPVWQVVR